MAITAPDTYTVYECDRGQLETTAVPHLGNEIVQIWTSGINIIGEEGICEPADEFNCFDSNDRGDPESETYGRLFEWFGVENPDTCTIQPAPNFFTFDALSSDYDAFLDSSGYDHLYDYVYVRPEINQIGDGIVRVSARDTGINEGGYFTQVRTGYSKFKGYIQWW